LRERLGDRVQEGDFVTSEGRVVGRHPGHQFFTIGQRRGLGIALGRPAYVVAIDPDRNRVVVGSDDELRSTEFGVEETNWIDGRPSGPVRATVKIRYNGPGAEATVETREPGESWVRFDEPQRAVTPGQAAVFYRGDEVIGGGWIRGSAAALRPSSS